MDLWIRSQDKEMLCKANCVDLMHNTDKTSNVFLNGDFPNLIVGCYENKRALEIIDEIQEILYPNLFAISRDMVENDLTKSFSNSHILTRNHNEVNIYERQSCVYEMPKE